MSKKVKEVKVNKFSLIGFVAIFLLSADIFAQSLSYEEVPNHESRERAPEVYRRFPGWTNIEIVGNGTVRRPLVALIGPAIDASKFKLLNLDFFDVIPSQVSILANELNLPFIISLHYQKSEDPVLKQGTINTYGVITIQRKKNGDLAVREIKFYDSQWSEVVGRNVLGTLSEFDGHFVEAITTPILKSYLKDETHRQVLLKVISETQPTLTLP